ncbi:MAG: hypothetical protein LBR23_08480 [Spirochaetaceae bacterium]|nr:hypothetical protein [Spirochaetaceae bacterium]
MNAIKRTITLPSARSLTLGELLPKTMGAGEVDITLIIADRPSQKTDASVSGIAPECDDAFGIWKDRDISLAQIREKAWRR